MRKALIYGVLIGALAAPAAYAQSSSNQNATSTQKQGGTTMSQSSGANDARQLATARRIESDLTKAGFTDVNVVAESFVIQAKSKDGDPVVMTIGPHGMSMFQTINASGSGTTGGKSNGMSDNGTMKH